MKEKSEGKKFFPLLMGLFIICGSAPFFVFSEKIYFNDRIYPGISVGTISLAGLNREEAERVLRESFDELKESGIVVLYGEKKVRVPFHQPSSSPDIPSIPLIDINIDGTIDRAFYYGREAAWFEKYGVLVKGLFVVHAIQPSIIANADLFTSALQKEFSAYEASPKNAEFHFDSTTQDFFVQQEEQGKTFDYTRALHSAIEALERFQAPSVELAITHSNPVVTKEALLPLLPDLREFFPIAPLELTDGDHIWEIDAATISSWMTEKEGMLAMREEAIGEFLLTEVAPKLFIQSSPPRFEMKDEKLILTNIPQSGHELDDRATISAIRKEFFEGRNKKVSLIMHTVKFDPIILEGQPAIREMVASAETDFKGSPKNRRGNIAVGAEKINGILVAPGEEFSLIKQFGAIDEKHGFLPELVIKGDRTKPEYGGGLCQVSTALFRTVTFAGLPIIERKNHSFRVSYYEPPIGFDATVYDPSPDFRFKNDMENAILIQTRISGTKLTVELWGTKDGRIIEVDNPKVFNVRKATATKIIESETLKEGEKKCTEKARNGADAVFQRRVMYPNGEKMINDFKSHYIVWPAVCYVGKRAEKKEAPNLIESKTPLETPSLIPLSDPLWQSSSSLPFSNPSP